MKYCSVCDRKYEDEMRVCGVDGTSLKSLTGGDTVLDAIMGRTIKGRYEVLKKLGEGGMGTVYLAEQVSIGRKVALKLLQGNYAKKDEFIARFRREARLAASLSHRNIVTIYDFDQDSDDTLFIAMEYVDGRKLTDVIRSDGPLDVQRAVRLGSQIAEGLDAAHRQGVIHRDIKPDNIMIIGNDDTEEVKLMDFGIARLRDTGAMSHLTQTGMIMGTPAYMSPEQAEGTEVSDKTDIYALGIVLYEMLSGAVPFKATTPGALLVKQIQEVPVELRKLRREVPAGVEQIVMQALEKKPQSRQHTMREVAQELKRVENTAVAESAPRTIVAGNTTMMEELPRTIAATKVSQGEFLGGIKDVNRKYLGLGFIGFFLTAALVFGVTKFMDQPAPDEPRKEPPVVAEPVREPVFVAPSRSEPEEVKRQPAPARPSLEKSKPVEKRIKIPDIQDYTPREKNIRESQSTDTVISNKPSPDQAIANNTKIQDHIKIARVLRERGEYADAVAELGKAKGLDPKDAQVQAELEKTRKACEAERQILGNANLRC